MIVNYISVCIYFPSVVITYHYYWKDFVPFRHCRNKKSRDTSLKLLALDQNQEKFRNDAPQDEMTKLFKAVVRWFETTYAKCIILHKRVKWVLLILFASLTTMFFVYAMHLGPDEEQVGHLIH